MIDSRIEHPRVTRDADVLTSVAEDASGLRRLPDGLARPQSEAEVQELVRLAASTGEPLTAQGLLSSTTGSSVVSRGLALSMVAMDRILEIDEGLRFARVEPGINLGHLKRTLAEKGLFYPPDPTSENECSLGGTVATNASGSRTYRYGPTRDWIRALRVVTAGGEARAVRRVEASKNATGYFGFQDPVDPFIGSEGTLGLVTEIEIQLLPLPAEVLAGWAFFRDWREALAFVRSVVANDPTLRGHAGRGNWLAAGVGSRDGAKSSPAMSSQRMSSEGVSSERISSATTGPADPLTPRCLELFDRAALDLVRKDPIGPPIPEEAGAALLFEEEAEPGRLMDKVERWAAALEEATPLASRAFLAQTPLEHETLRKVRHAIPARMNEAGDRAVPDGGGKLSTDFAVPLAHLETVMFEMYGWAKESIRGTVTAYGHVGNGHPHFNIVALDGEDLEAARRAIRIMSRRALELGGTISAEHGIGKIKAELFRDLYPTWQLDAMRGVKAALDPKGILAPGNLFAE